MGRACALRGVVGTAALAGLNVGGGSLNYAGFELPFGPRSEPNPLTPSVIHPLQPNRQTSLAYADGDRSRQHTVFPTV